MADRIAGLIIDKGDTDQCIARRHGGRLTPAFAIIIREQHMAELTNRHHARAGTRHIKQECLRRHIAGHGIFKSLRFAAMVIGRAAALMQRRQK